MWEREGGDVRGVMSIAHGSERGRFTHTRRTYGLQGLQNVCRQNLLQRVIVHSLIEILNHQHKDYLYVALTLSSA